MATANTTGGTALQDFIDTAPLELTVVLAQETWLGPTRIDEAAAWCERRGWKAALSAANRTEAGGWSAGVAILVRSYVGMRWLDAVEGYSISRARAVAAIVEMHGYPCITMASVYLTAGQGLGRDNLALLAAVGAAVEAQGFPTLMAGDYSCSPGAMRNCGFPESAGLCIVAPAEPTYFSGATSSTLDYYMLEQSLFS